MDGVFCAHCLFFVFSVLSNFFFASSWQQLRIIIIWAELCFRDCRLLFICYLTISSICGTPPNIPSNEHKTKMRIKIFQCQRYEQFVVIYFRKMWMFLCRFWKYVLLNGNPIIRFKKVPITITNNYIYVGWHRFLSIVYYIFVFIADSSVF